MLGVRESTLPRAAIGSPQHVHTREFMAYAEGGQWRYSENRSASA